MPAEADLGIAKTREQLEAGDLEGTQLLPEERPIFLRWYQRHGRGYSDYYFGRRIGPVIAGIEVLPENIQRQVRAVTQLRIDAECWDGDQPIIIEVKPVAGSTGYGQLLAYRAWWMKEGLSMKEPKLFLVCEYVKPHFRPLYEDAGIQIFEV
jgi:hypothetical protein